jgi:hypothetical protein
MGDEDVRSVAVGQRGDGRGVLGETRRRIGADS